MAARNEKTKTAFSDMKSDFQNPKKSRTKPGRTRMKLQNNIPESDLNDFVIKNSNSKSVTKSRKKRIIGNSPDGNPAKRKVCQQIPISSFFKKIHKNLEETLVADVELCHNVNTSSIAVKENDHINLDENQSITNRQSVIEDVVCMKTSDVFNTVEHTNSEAEISVSTPSNDVKTNVDVHHLSHDIVESLDFSARFDSTPENLNFSKMSNYNKNIVINSVPEVSSSTASNNVNTQLRTLNVQDCLDCEILLDDVPKTSKCNENCMTNSVADRSIFPVSSGILNDVNVSPSTLNAKDDVDCKAVIDASKMVNCNENVLTKSIAEISISAISKCFTNDADVSSLTLNVEDPLNSFIKQSTVCRKLTDNEMPSCNENGLLSLMSDMDWEGFDDTTFLSEEALLKLSPSKNVGGPPCQNKFELDLKVISNNSKFRILRIDRIKPNEVELLIEDFPKPTGVHLKCVLQGFWAESVLSEGDVVSVLSPFIDGCAVINDQCGFLVVNPDFLVSSTAVVSTLFCMRKAVLNHKYRYWGSGNRIMMIGNFVHQLFQQAVNDHKNLEKDIQDILFRILKHTENLISMCGQGISEKDVLADLMSFVPSISQWINKYCEFGERSMPPENLCVTEVRDIEDNIWCIKYGLKGKIDLTVEVDFPKKNIKQLMPLELKTGMPSFSAEHEGQVNLYTLMMEDRTQERSDGLLLYLKGGPQMKQIPSNHNIQRGLIQLRNELVHYIFKLNKQSHSHKDTLDKASFETNYLPEPLNNKRLCQKCSYLLPCTVYQRAYQVKELDTQHAMSNLMPNATRHLDHNHLNYFRLWSFLLYLESASASLEKSFWNEDAKIREKEGLCLSNMILRDDTLTQHERDGDAFIHSFFRSVDSDVSSEISTAGLKAGDYVAISNQKNNFEVALATGYVTTVSDACIQISVERDIQKLSRYDGYLFRLDKIMSTSANATSYSNLMKLMTPDDMPTRLREVIIERRPARFLPTLSKSIAVKARPFLKVLNKPQRKAVFKVLMAQDYTLIKGMPGTGKTATIVALVRLLVQMGHSVLLTSHTHSAVDNILIKLLECNVDFVRIGQTARIHSDIIPYSFQHLTKDMKTVDELSSFIKSKMVVASTCLGINHVIFETRKFDYCIVDEASQIVQPICLGPLYLADKFVLAGDPKQLPPVVINEKAKENGMQESLFIRLETSSNCIELSLQYRMNKEIMRLCNELTYNNTMQCGSEEVASSVLDINIARIQKLNSEWLFTALDCELSRSFLFLNTDTIPARESRDGQNKVKNDIEMQLVCLLTNCLIKSGVSSHDIGVITPYRAQVELIVNCLSKRNISKVEVNTVDQYQGKDKEVVIISCVRSSCETVEEEKSASLIIGDERRLNVAISRAKKKLLLIGSKSTLVSFKCFERLFNSLLPNQILDLPPDAHMVMQDNDQL